MRPIVLVQDVDAPVVDVYSQLTQFEELPDVLDHVEEVEQLDDTHVRWTTRVDGVRRTFTTRIVEQVPDRRIEWRTVDGDLEHHGAVTLHEGADGGCRMVVVLDRRPDAIVDWVVALLGMDRRALRDDVALFAEELAILDEPAGRWGWHVREGQVIGAGEWVRELPDAALAST